MLTIVSWMLLLRVVQDFAHLWLLLGSRMWPWARMRYVWYVYVDICMYHHVGCKLPLAMNVLSIDRAHCWFAIWLVAWSHNWETKRLSLTIGHPSLLTSVCVFQSITQYYSFLSTQNWSVPETSSSNCGWHPIDLFCWGPSHCCWFCYSWLMALACRDSCWYRRFKAGYCHWLLAWQLLFSSWLQLPLLVADISRPKTHSFIPRYIPFMVGQTQHHSCGMKPTSSNINKP